MSERKDITQEVLRFFQDLNITPPQSDIPSEESNNLLPSQPPTVSPVVLETSSPSPSPKEPKTRKKSQNINQELNPWTNLPYSDQYYQILEQRKKLPVWVQLHQAPTEDQPNILQTIKDNQVVIIWGETGSGKTTQIPQFLLSSGILKGNQMIGCTQPRRVAAMSISSRVANEMDVKLGEHVGYSIRFEDLSGPKTILKYLTDGMLLREMMIDSNLERYGMIIIDEAHERTLSTDVAMGLLKDLLKRRPDLKLLVMSATLDSIKLQTYFDNAPMIKIPGRQYPVDIMYTEQPVDDYVQATINTITEIHATEGPGDILAFLTGEEEIDQVCRTLTQQLGPSCICLPLYSALPPTQQMKVFETFVAPDGSPIRKVVVSTNIAETSITVDGIVYVIDSGFVKQKVFNPSTRVESLFITPVSRASAQQRAGRAGRTRPGKCFRLFPEKAYQALEEQTNPEILRSNYASVTLMLIKIGVRDLVHFDLIEPPAPTTLMRALECLVFLKAIDLDCKLTPLGAIMAEFPLDPLLSKVVIESPKYSCSNEILSIVSMLSVANCFSRPLNSLHLADQAHAQFSHPNGDHITLLNVYHAYKLNKESKDWCFKHFLHYRSLATADNVREQLLKIVRKLNLKMSSASPESPNYYFNIRKALTAGFFMQTAHLQKNGYFAFNSSSKNVSCQIHPSSGQVRKKPDWCIYNELVITTKNYLRTVTVIEPEWLLEVAPHYFTESNFPNNHSLRKLLETQNRRKSKRH